MELYDVYPLMAVEPVRGEGCRIWDRQGVEYLDMYGGHAVISIGHSHPRYVERVQSQVARLGFYSNSVQNPLQCELARRLGEMSGYADYSLFLCNSGAEANENALKLASYHTGRKRVLALRGAFHGRTSAAVEATDNERLQASLNKNGNVTFIDANCIESAQRELKTGEYAAFIVEPIQGVAGIYELSTEYLQIIAQLCRANATMLIFDEIQCGYARSGEFFAHQAAGVRGDIVTIAKGMANGLPIGGVIISPEIEAWSGQLGSTFGGNHLSVSGAIAVLDVICETDLQENARAMGQYIAERLSEYCGEGKAISEIRGRGLMLGIDMAEGYEDVRAKLLSEYKIFTGVAGKNTIRLLPPLTITRTEIDEFIDAFKNCIKR